MLEYKKKVDEIEKYLGLMEIKPNFNLIYERIYKLEQHKTYQIDENRKEYRNIEELERRIEKLEKNNRDPGPAI